jgi:hypothetical protein
MRKVERMRWTAAFLLRPVTFVLAIVAAVLTGNRTGSFWFGLLAFFVAVGCGRALRAFLRGRPGRAALRLVWPAAAVGYAVLFGWLGLPSWANFLVSTTAATMTSTALLPTRASVRIRLGRRRDWSWLDL